MSKTFYEVIGVSPNATAKEIEDACLRFGATYRPDKNPGDANAARMFALFEEAFVTLTDPAKRSAYDATIGIRVTKADQSARVPEAEPVTAVPKENGELAAPQRSTSSSTGMSYSEAILQDKARSLAMLHQAYALRIEEELDPRRERLSVELWREIQCFALYLVSKAIRGGVHLHPDNREQLQRLFIEAWSMLRQQTQHPPAAGIFARATIALIGATGLGAKWDREEFDRFRAGYDAFLRSEYRNTQLREADDPTALAVLLMHRVKEGRTYSGNSLSFGFTKEEKMRLAAHVIDCFTDATEIL